MDRKEREAAFHDVAVTEATRRRLWTSYYAVAEAPYRHYDEIVAAHARGGQVLEYGCGAGGRSDRIAAAGAVSIAGIDISPEAIRVAEDRALDGGYAELTDYRVMDAEELQFEDESFDVVCGTSILHHLDLPRAYSEVARVLRPGGVGVFLEPLGHNPAINLYRRRTPQLRTEDEHPLVIADLKAAERHFRTVSVKHFTLLPLLAVPLRRTQRFQRLVASLERADERLFAAVPAARRYSWQVVVELYP